MNTKDIYSSSDTDIAGSYAAMQRAAISAQDLAIKTNTGIVVSADGKPKVISAKAILQMCDLDAQTSDSAVAN